MITTYKVTSKVYEGYAMYVNGWLTQLYGEKLPTTVIELPVGDLFPVTEIDLINSELWTAKEIKGKTVAEKVALFCMLHKSIKGFAYRATKEEKANLKLVTVDEKLLNAYLTNTNYPLSTSKSMADYVRHYNTIRDLATNGTPKKKSAFPDFPDREYEKGIEDPAKLQAYWEHLRAQGYRKQDGTWIKSTTL